MHRVEDLADRSPEQVPEGGVGFKRLVPFDQIIAEAREVGVTSKQVTQEYLDLVQRVGTELEILVEMPEEQLRKQMSPKVAEGVLKVRQEQVEIQPGYDGEYGKVEIFKKGQESVGEKQLTLF